MKLKVDITILPHLHIINIVLFVFEVSKLRRKINHELEKLGKTSKGII